MFLWKIICKQTSLFKDFKYSYSHLFISITTYVASQLIFKDNVLWIRKIMKSTLRLRVLDYTCSICYYDHTKTAKLIQPIIHKVSISSHQLLTTSEVQTHTRTRTHTHTHTNLMDKSNIKKVGMLPPAATCACFNKYMYVGIIHNALTNNTVISKHSFDS